MKRIAFLWTVCAMFTLQIQAQVSPNKLEIGLNVNQFQNDFGIGVHLISPYFLKSKVAVRAGANFQWFEYFNGTETTWSPYQNIQIGLRGRSEVIEDKIFMYGEGGVLAILPNNEFSNNDTEFGGYGVFGFEFRPITKFAYFIEIGAVGTGAKANKIITSPIYSNGFLMSVGLRIGL